MLLTLLHHFTRLHRSFHSLPVLHSASSFQIGLCPQAVGDLKEEGQGRELTLRGFPAGDHVRLTATGGYSLHALPPSIVAIKSYRGYVHACIMSIKINVKHAWVWYGLV